ncbi:hypothetical protein GALL_372370 [mine drainage metagenome]|uniref:Uncharacterized protein n=1 Tax=mine drainage metagenome TaxID=410659 RepID=A0A1J5QU31_9ZZZZ
MPAAVQPHHHHFDGDHRIVYQEAEGDNERAQRDALQVDVKSPHQHECDRQHQRNAERHHQSGAQAQRQETDGQHDGYRLDQGLHEQVDGMFYHRGLIGHLMHFDAERQVGLDVIHGIFQRFPELDDVATLPHGNFQPDGIPPHIAHLEDRRVFIAALHAGDIAQAERVSAVLDAHFPDAGNRAEIATDAGGNAVAAGFDAGGAGNGVLLAQGLDDGLRIDAGSEQFFVVEFNIDFFRLFADEIHFGYTIDTQQLQPDLVHVLTQLCIAEAVGSERIDRAEGVAEFVVGVRPLHTIGQLLPHIVQFLADLVERFRVAAPGRVVAQIDEQRGFAGLGVAFDEIDVRRFLQFLFQAGGDLLLHLTCRGSWPVGLHQHYAPGEVGVFGLAQPGVGISSGDQQGKHEVAHQMVVHQRPGREVEAFLPRGRCVRGRLVWIHVACYSSAVCSLGRMRTF